MEFNIKLMDEAGKVVLILDDIDQAEAEKSPAGKLAVRFYRLLAGCSNVRPKGTLQ